MQSVTGTPLESGDGNFPMIKLFVGLGNPGPEYEATRHNAGFWWIDALSRELKAPLSLDKSYHGQVARVTINGQNVWLLKPLTFMNLSGAPVVALAQFFKVPVDNVVAVHDELDVPYGQVRVKRGGGEGGHNGLRSMSKSLGSKEYARVRFGIGRPPGRQDPADYVLSDFSGGERKELEFLVDRAADVVEAVVLEGVEWAQNKYHGSP
jgi:PTH1 family peptidyl-tRNA hydrolase